MQRVGPAEPLRNLHEMTPFLAIRLFATGGSFGDFGPPFPLRLDPGAPALPTKMGQRAVASPTTFPLFPRCPTSYYLRIKSKALGKLEDCGGSGNAAGELAVLGPI